MPTPRLSSGAIRIIDQKIDDLFDTLKARAARIGGKSLYITTSRDFSIPGLYERAVAAEGGRPDFDQLNRLIEIFSDYLDKARADAKARIKNEIMTTLQQVRGGRVDNQILRVALDRGLQEIWDTVTSNVNRIIATELQNSVILGVREGINRINTSLGVKDPVVAFIVVHDTALCDECRRLHLLPDGTTPRLWYSSEVKNGYHKKGEDSPSWNGEHPHCFTGETKLYTQNGICTLKELFDSQTCVHAVVDNRIKKRKNKDGLWFDRHASGTTIKAATPVYDTGIQECLRITLDTGISVEVSVGHDFWVDVDNGGGEKRRADQLKIGDKVPLLSGMGGFGRDSFEDLAELMGNLMGDGTISSSAAAWRFFGNDIPYGMELWGKFKQFAGTRPGLSQEAPKISPPNEKYNVSSMGFHSGVLAKIFIEEFGLSKKPRRVPERIWKADKKTTAAFLRGLYAADGHSEYTPSVTLAQNDKEFLKEIQLLLANFGIRSRILPHGDKKTKTITYADGRQFETNRKPCWRLIFGGWSQVAVFRKEIGFGVPIKNERLQKFLAETEGDVRLGAWRTAHIESIESIGKQQTYCLTEMDTNTVTANGIVVGQCRCAPVTVVPGWGFKNGKLTYIGEGWDEIKNQRG